LNQQEASFLIVMPHRVFVLARVRNQLMVVSIIQRGGASFPHGKSGIHPALFCLETK
jgi:hypothetical protein